jgi:hypothetical protein
MGRHDASDYEAKHAKSREKLDWTWDSETNDGGMATGCLLGLFTVPYCLLRRTR